MFYDQLLFSVFNYDWLVLGGQLAFAAVAAIAFKQYPTKPLVWVMIGCSDGWVFLCTGHRSPKTVKSFMLDSKFLPQEIRINPEWHDLQGINLGRSPDARLMNAVALRSDDAAVVEALEDYKSAHRLAETIWGTGYNQSIDCVGMNCARAIALLKRYANPNNFVLYCGNASVDLAPAYTRHGLVMYTYLLPVANGAHYPLANRFIKFGLLMAVSAVALVFAPSVVDAYKILTSRYW